MATIPTESKARAVRKPLNVRIKPESRNLLDKAAATGKAKFQSLQQFYTLIGADEPIIKRLSEAPALYQLLKDAVHPVRAAFGDAAILQLKAQESDDDVLLKVIVHSEVSSQEAEEALDRFDEAWWLDNCSRSSGSLVFDYAVR